MNASFIKSSKDSNNSIVKRQQRSLSYTKPRNIVKRNEDLQSTFNTFKETQSSPDRSIYLQNYQMHNLNTNYDTFYSKKNEQGRYAMNGIPNYQKPNGSKNEFNHYAPLHYNNMHLARHKKYTKQQNRTNEQERLNVEIRSGSVLKRQDYMDSREFLSKSVIQSSPRNNKERNYSQNNERDSSVDLARQNLYISSIDNGLKVNQDLIKNRNIRHVSAASDLSPDWFKTSMNYYSKPFQQGKVHTFNGGQFQIVQQNQKNIYANLSQPKNPGGMFNDCTRRDRKTLKEIKKDTYQMSWDVSDNEKSFRVTQKIGTQNNWNNNDTIKSMVSRRQATDQVSEKVGFSTQNSQILRHNSFVNTLSVA